MLLLADGSLLLNSESCSQISNYLHISWSHFLHRESIKKLQISSFRRPQLHQPKLNTLFEQEKTIDGKQKLCFSMLWYVRMVCLLQSAEIFAFRYLEYIETVQIRLETSRLPLRVFVLKKISYWSKVISRTTEEETQLSTTETQKSIYYLE